MSSPPVIRPVRKSLITIGLQARSASSSSSDHGDNRQSSDPETTQSTGTSIGFSGFSDVICPTESMLPLLEGPSRSSNLLISSSESSGGDFMTSEKFSFLDERPSFERLPTNSSMFVAGCGRMTIRDRELLGPFVIPHQRRIPPPNPSSLVKGFGNFKIEKEIKRPEKLTPCFPPLSNAVYDSMNRLDHIDRSKPDGHIPNLDGATFVKDYLLESRENKQQIGDCDEKVVNSGELVANMSNWTYKTYDPEEGPSAYGTTSIRHFKQDFITDVNKAVRRGLTPFEMCNKCGRRHIPWGPPISLPERDTCLSMLPEWFQKRKFENPWLSFIELNNDIVRGAEREQGRALDPYKKTWDKEWHDPTPEWKAVGRHGGWWKCRSGLEDGQENVSDLERNCNACHREKTEYEKAWDARSHDEEEKVIQAHELVQQWTQVQMEKDKAFVIARIRHIGQ